MYVNVPAINVLTRNKFTVKQGKNLLLKYFEKKTSTCKAKEILEIRTEEREFRNCSG